MSCETKIIVSITDGRVVPWFSSEDPVPAKFVVVPPALLVKFKSGEIADGKALAKECLAADAEVGVVPQNIAVLPPPEKGGDANPGAVDPADIEKGEPSSSEVNHFPAKRIKMRA